MSLGPPPPLRSRRERIRLPGRRPLAVAGIVAAAVAGLAITEPWAASPRRTWTAAPVLPAQRTALEAAWLRRLAPWLRRLAPWIGFVRNASEDPSNSVVQDCRRRFSELGPAPRRLRDVGDLARDTCAVEAALATDRRGAALSFETSRAAKVNVEEREASRDFTLLLKSLRLSGAPGGRIDARYSRIATRLSGRQVTARCFSSSADWRSVATSPGRTEPFVGTLLGFAVFSEDRIDLSPSVCRALDALKPRAAPSFAQTLAVEVLTHESEHLRGVDGIQNEATTDCYAAQRMFTTARLLGVSPDLARRMSKVYFRAGRLVLPPEYRSPECRAGGKLDLTPADGSFP